MKKTYIYEAITVIAVIAAGIIFWQMQGDINNNGTISQNNTTNTKTYLDEAAGIQFVYPADTEVGGTRNTYAPKLYISRITYHTPNKPDVKELNIIIATTTVTDLKNLKFDYFSGLSKDNPDYNSTQATQSPKWEIKSSEMTTVGGKSALKEVVIGPNASSTYTWIHVINKGKLYSIVYGINRGYENTANKATPDDETKLQQYVDLFLSTVKFF